MGISRHSTSLYVEIDTVIKDQLWDWYWNQRSLMNGRRYFHTEHTTKENCPKTPLKQLFRGLTSGGELIEFAGQNLLQIKL